MLRDLYMLSCFFEGPQSVLYEDDLKRRYGIQAVRDASLHGFLEFYCAPCAKNDKRFFCRLSALGRSHVEEALAV